MSRVWDAGSQQGEGDDMIRRLFSIITMLSLLFCVATALLWMISHSSSTYPSIHFVHAGQIWELGVIRGYVLMDNDPQTEIE